MNAIKYVFTLAFLLAVAVSCQVEKYEDVSFVDSVASPEKLSALFDITQDNTGLVTIYPNGQGVSTYDITFGDGTTTTSTVTAGANITHKYAEGSYDVKLTGKGVTGKTVDATQKLTVSFRAPENLEANVAIDASNVFKVNVSAKAAYETLFKVYFGDAGTSEVPQSVLEGVTISHVYASVGTYTVTVVALSGGKATTEIKKTVTIVNPVLLPVNFESTTLVYNIGNFDGGGLTVVSNPQSKGINTSTKVAQMVKSAGQTWGGSTLKLGSPIDFSTGKIFRMKVFSPRVGAKVLLKVENASDGSINFEKEVATTVANDWEDLIFDYMAIDATKSYQTLVFIFDNGTMGDGSANFTFLLDDIRLSSSMPAMTLPLDFQSSLLAYNFTNFDGGGVTVINNPQVSGINTSTKVAQMVKDNNQTWGGSWIGLDSLMDFSVKKTFKMKVYSPRVGAKVLLKVENATDGSKSFEKEVATTVANAWEVLTFDFSAINTANSYQKIVLIFDNGTKGDGSANYTFLFDDITLN
jgi:hypothetical protein